MFLLPRPFFVYVLGLTNINTFHLFHGNQGFLMVCRPKLSPTACFLWLIQLVLVLVFFNKEVSSLSWKIKIAGNAWSIFCMTIVSWTWLEPVACRHSPPPHRVGPQFQPSLSSTPLTPLSLWVCPGSMEQLLLISTRERCDQRFGVKDREEVLGADSTRQRKEALLSFLESKS